MKKTPTELGFKFPAEWERHSATWLGFPHNKSDFPGKIVPIYWVYGEIVRRLAEGETVRVIVNDEKHENLARRILTKVGANFVNIEFFRFPTNRGWMRDAGPIFVKNGNETAIVDFNFNAWSKYDDFEKDKFIPKLAADALNLKLFHAKHKDFPFVLEGGAIDLNGRGTMMTTEECLLDFQTQVRNPHLNKTEIEQTIKDFLGVSNIIWLGKGIEGDDTHGHIDDFCRFVNENTVVLCREKNGADYNHAVMEENFNRLQSARLENGEQINIIDLPMPKPLIFAGRRLPASYANFYIANSAVLVPTFNDENDRIALGILAELFTDRPIIGIHAVDLVWGLGTLHCLTQQQPAD